MGNVGFQELVLIAAVAMFVVGPQRLPGLARQAARAIAAVKREAGESIAELKQVAQVEGVGRELGELRGLAREVRDVRSSVARSLMSTTAPHRSRPVGEAGSSRPGDATTPRPEATTPGAPDPATPSA